MQAHTKIIIFWITGIGIMLVYARVTSILRTMHYYEEPSTFGDEGCVRIRSMGASEDQTRFNRNSLLAGEWKVLDYHPGEDRPGSVYVASGFRHSDAAKSTQDFVDQHLTVEELPIRNYPEGIDFHPHGMYIYKPDNTLYVVNHAFERGGERIDVFDIGTKPDGDGEESDPETDIPNQLTYKYSITDDWMQTEMNGILNSLVVVEPNKFYVTQYEAHAQDRSTDGWLDLETRGLIKILKMLVFRAKTTKVLYCEFDPTNAALDCRKAAGGFVMANGITHTADYKTLFVADTNSINVFDRNASTNDITQIASVDYSQTIDNLKYDEDSGKVYGGGVSHVFMSFYNTATAPGQEKETSTSGLFELSFDPTSKPTKRTQYQWNKTKGWTGRTVISTSKLNIATNGLRMNSHFVMGSGVEFKGLLVCPVVDDDVAADAAKSSSEQTTSEL